MRAALFFFTVPPSPRHVRGKQSCLCFPSSPCRIEPRGAFVAGSARKNYWWWWWPCHPSLLPVDVGSHHMIPLPYLGLVTNEEPARGFISLSFAAGLTPPNVDELYCQIRGT
jgi:hypothetical protein